MGFRVKFQWFPPLLLEPLDKLPFERQTLQCTLLNYLKFIFFQFWKWVLGCSGKFKKAVFCGHRSYSLPHHPKILVWASDIRWIQIHSEKCEVGGGISQTWLAQKLCSNWKKGASTNLTQTCAYMFWWNSCLLFWFFLQQAHHSLFLSEDEKFSPEWLHVQSLGSEGKKGVLWQQTCFEPLSRTLFNLPLRMI